MLSRDDKERTKLLVVTDAEMRSSNKVDVIQIAHRYIYEYFRTKASDIPNDIFARESFDSESGTISAEHIKQDNFEMWAGRLSEPDSTIAGRSWHLELTTGKISSGYRFGSRLSCFSRNLDFEFDPAVPRVYRQLASQGILHGDGVKLTASPIDIVGEDDVEWLLALINNPHRWRNVIALAVDEQGQSSGDAFALSNRLCGAAHVVRIFPAGSFLLSDAIEKYLSVFDYGSSLETQLEAAMAAKKASEMQAEESLALAVQEETERIEAEAARDQERGRSASMSARIRALEEQLRSAKRDLPTSKRPNSYQEISPWVQSEFAGRIQLCGKALRGLREAKYENIELVWDLIELLATSYVDSKRGTDSAWHTFEGEIERWGVELSRSISGSRAGEQGEEYFVPYRGRKRFLEWHLKKGNSRDPRRDLRIYFFWDEEDEEIVLGYLTGHLDNRLT